MSVQPIRLLVITAQYLLLHLANRGRIRSADGASYEGDYQDGQKHGRGIFRSADGDTYEVDFQHGQRHG